MIKYEYCLLIVNSITQRLTCPVKPASISKEVAGMSGIDIINGLGALGFSLKSNQFNQAESFWVFERAIEAPAPDRPGPLSTETESGPAADGPYTPAAFGRGRIHWHDSIRQQFVRAYLTNSIQPGGRADFTDRYESLRDDLLNYVQNWVNEDSYTYAGFMSVVEIFNSLLACLFTEQEIKELLS